MVAQQPSGLLKSIDNKNKIGESMLRLLYCLTVAAVSCQDKRPPCNGSCNRRLEEPISTIAIALIV